MIPRIVDLFFNNWTKLWKQENMKYPSCFEVVSKKAYARGRKLAKNNGISKWANAVMKARKELGVTGFCAVKKGTKLYTLARKYYDN